MNNFENVIKKIQEFVEKKYITRAVLKINQNKKNIFSYCFGINDLEKNSLMKEDLIFRAYSMTKTLTAAAFLTLVDEKKVSLKDPLSKFYPEFKNMKVLNKNNLDEVIECKNEILISHLLTMTSVFTYFGNKNETQKETTNLLSNFAKKQNNKFMNYESFMKKLSEILLEFEPGTNWRYGLSLDVIAAVIEKNN